MRVLLSLIPDESYIRCQVSGIRYQVSGIRYQVSGETRRSRGTDSRQMILSLACQHAGPKQRGSTGAVLFKLTSCCAP